MSLSIWSHRLSRTGAAGIYTLQVGLTGPMQSPEAPLLLLSRLEVHKL